MKKRDEKTTLSKKMAWSSQHPQHQVRIQPDKGPTLAENAFHSSTRPVCWSWPQQELWLQVGWQGHLQHYSSMITSCTLILDSKFRAAAKSTAARFIEDLERSQSQRVGHSETLSWPGSYILLSFIKARQISVYPLSKAYFPPFPWPGRFPISTPINQ